MANRRTKSLVIAGLLLVGAVGSFCVARLVLRRVEQSNAQRQQFVEITAKAEQGDAQAQANLGDQYFYGEGVAIDQAEAAKWWLKAAEQGDPKSQFSMAFSYFKGLGVAKDPTQGLKWYQSTIAQGYDIRAVSTRLNTGIDIRMKGAGEGGSPVTPP